MPVSDSPAVDGLYETMLDRLQSYVPHALIALWLITTGGMYSLAHNMTAESSSSLLLTIVVSLMTAALWAYIAVALFVMLAVLAVGFVLVVLETLGSLIMPRSR